MYDEVEVDESRGVEVRRDVDERQVEGGRWRTEIEGESECMRVLE